MNSVAPSPPPPSANQIMQCLAAILTTADESVRKQSGQFLSELERVNPSPLLMVLLDIVESEEVRPG